MNTLHKLRCPHCGGENISVSPYGAYRCLDCIVDLALTELVSIPVVRKPKKEEEQDENESLTNT